MNRLTDKQIWEKTCKDGKGKLFETVSDNTPYKTPSKMSHIEQSSDNRIKRLEKDMKNLTKTVEELENKIRYIQKFSKFEAMKNKNASINNLNIKNENKN